MRPLPIRIKLTAWYFAILALAFAAFGGVAFIAMQRSIETSVDEGLQDRADGIRELIERVLPEGGERLKAELREHSELSEEGGLCQVSDLQGHWLYRSEMMRRSDVPAPAASGKLIYDLQTSDPPLRVLATDVQVGGSSYHVQVAAPMDDFNDALEHFKWILLLSSPILLLLASAGGYWIGRHALMPVDEITKAARTITSTNLSNRLAVPQSRDELQNLSETLNGMLERLEASFRRITQFTADASHELRTPVALMRTTAEISLRKSRPEVEYREALTQILRELEITSALIEKLMLLARADSGVEGLQFAPVDLADTLREACRQGRILAQGKGITLDEESEAPIGVRGDVHALQRLFLILLDNAVKYTPSGGSITARLATVDGFVVTEIRDTGIGISAADLPHIFERFYRADKARSRELGGAGLGLSIAQWIANAHGGVIEVQSALGQGSVFLLRLPISNG
jgi:heavy metal sensor kinase